MKNKTLYVIALGSLSANVLLLGSLLIPKLEQLRAAKQSVNVGNTLVEKSIPVTTPSKDNLFDEVNPVSGFEINASYGSLGPKMISMGVIDRDKFISTYDKASRPLNEEEKNILLKGSDSKIKITQDNSYFLLNFFWAVGLANKSDILDNGDMVKYGGKNEAGNFASTGGWTLAKDSAMNYYSKAALIPLTKDQENLVKEVASNIYRPCCNNSTAFPDCNHGMALLGVLQLMASSGATKDQMYEAGKYFNAYWFPGDYYDIALYFKAKEGKSFKDVDSKTVLSKDFSSASGIQSVKRWLVDQGLEQKPPKTGGGCGV